MNCITSRQVNVDLIPHVEGFRFQHEGRDCVLPSMDKVHAFFQEKCFDTVKLCQDGKRKYLHFIDDEVEVFDSKKALRKTLSQEGSGAWIEEKGGKKRYFVDDSGWFQTSFKQVSKKEFLQRVDSPSTLQKVLGIGLGVLALLPGALEIKERLPFGASEAGMGLLALQQKSPLLGALGLSFIPSSAMAQAVGTEFQVNNYTASIQREPAIAPLKDGGFVVAWHSSGQDGSSYGIFAQRYNNAGAIVDSEFQVNNYTTSNQRNPDIAPLNDGGFVVTWNSLDQDGDGYGIFAQKYDASGALFGSEFQVNSYTTSWQESPVIAPLNDGGFVVAWQSSSQDGSGYGIFAQRFDSIGAIVGSEFQVNNYTASDQQFPAIGSLNDGGFVVAWESVEQDGNSSGIFAQKYDHSGAIIGSEFQVNNYTASNQEISAIAPLNDGGFVVSWISDGQDGDQDGIFAQRYDRDGNPVPLTYVPPMSSASTLSSNADTTNLPSSQLSLTSSATTGNSALSSSTTPSLSASSTSGVQTTPQTDNSSPSGFGIPALIEVVYGEIYPIQLNSQTIGTFTISGSSGLYSSSNLNTLNIELDPDFILEDGDTAILFSVEEEVEPQWESITLVNSNGCLNAEGELVQNEENSGLDFRIIFRPEGESCSIYGGASKFGAIPVLTSGGLI